MPTTRKFSFSAREAEECPAEDWRSLSYRWMGGDRVLEARFGHRLASELDWAEAIEEGRRITVQAQQAEQEDARDQVLFLNVYTDAGRVYYDEAPETKQDALGRLRQVREALTLSHDPFDNRIADNSEKGDGNGNGGPPNAGGPPPRGRLTPGCRFRHRHRAAAWCRRWR